ncbi:hypothetical protein [Kosmotoga pacifica]|uniref:Uncharacterized protein n=1 Tax=Kosmotoga pacifica TaxID=1330330 RepID=A0A0G2ZCU0_9BACT|nr:hypothetical protein [Kosmotoga pacifica]AKI96573.1 hypothetical protein IX53_00645 [Kosmotoga pacifica]
MLFGRFYTTLEKNALISDMKRDDGIVTIMVHYEPLMKEYIFVLGELVLVRIRNFWTRELINMIKPKGGYLEWLVNKTREDFMKGCISKEEVEKLIDPNFLKEYPGEWLEKPKEEVVVHVEERDMKKLCDLLVENGYVFTVPSWNAEE